jgi:hypothetical protein
MSLKEGVKVKGPTAERNKIPFSEKSGFSLKRRVSMRALAFAPFQYPSYLFSE